MVSTIWILWQFITFAEHIRMKLFESNCGWTGLLHPISFTYISGNESSPDGYCFHRPAARSCLETNNTRVFITVHTKVVEEAIVQDFTALYEHQLRQVWMTTYVLNSICSLSSGSKMSSRPGAMPFWSWCFIATAVL